MTIGVNLVPMSQRVVRTRARRRVVWTGVGLISAVLVASAWAIEATATRGVGHLSERVAAAEHQRAEIQQRLAVAEADRRHALDTLQTLAAARRPQPWARRWVALTEAAPPGVFLTAMTLSELTTGGRSEPGVTVSQQGAPASGAVPHRVPAGRRSPSGGARKVVLRGYALDHGSLIQFLHVLQNLPGWYDVELIRATSEPLRAGLAVAFELACAAQEDES